MDKIIWDEYYLVSQIVPVMMGTREVNMPIVFMCVLIESQKDIAGETICKIQKFTDVKELVETGKPDGEEIVIKMSNYAVYPVRIGENYYKSIEFKEPRHF